MQFLFSLAAFAGLALAQNAVIGLPKAGQTVAAGSDIIVQVQRPVCRHRSSIFQGCLSNQASRTL